MSVIVWLLYDYEEVFYRSKPLYEDSVIPVVVLLLAVILC